MSKSTKNGMGETKNYDGSGLPGQSERESKKLDPEQSGLLEGLPKAKTSKGSTELYPANGQESKKDKACTGYRPSVT